MKELSNTNFKSIPFFVDSTALLDHKCGGCRYRVERPAIGGSRSHDTCSLVDIGIDLGRGTCLLWSEGRKGASVHDISASRIAPATAQYVEVDKVNCGSCKHYYAGLCRLWNGTVDHRQCCMVWEGR